MSNCSGTLESHLRDLQKTGCESLFPTQQLEISCCGSIYTMGISKSYKSEFLPPKNSHQQISSQT